MSTVTVPAASRRTRCGRHRWRSDLERAVEQILLLDLVRGGGTRRRRGRGGTGHHLEGATDLHGEVHRHEAPRSLVLRLLLDPHQLGVGIGLEHVVELGGDRKSTRLNSSHVAISYAVFCLEKKTTPTDQQLR